MTPHLAMHSPRGVESGRGRREEKKQKEKYQKSVYGKLKLPPDEATPFFENYVLNYAFPTIAVICTCLGCILMRTMKMYQKERWKGTSYFHGKIYLPSRPLTPHCMVWGSQTKRLRTPATPFAYFSHADLPCNSSSIGFLLICFYLFLGARRSAESLLPGLK